jgi:hypothetical protein
MFPALSSEKAIAIPKPSPSNEPSVMNENQLKSDAEQRLISEQRPARKSVLWLCGIAAIGAVVILVITSRHRAAPEPVISPVQNPEAHETGEVARSTPEPVAAAAPAQVSTPPIPVAFPTNSDPSAVARELVKRLSEMQPDGITPESAAKWNRDLESLVEQGTAAVSPLREFFQSKADVRFDTGKTNLLGEPSLRMAFIEVLFNVPAPDNVYLQEEVLRTTTDPAEVALLAHQLEAQEPGKYRDLIISTAQASLAQSRAGVWRGRDASPLVKILKQYGVESPQ